VHAGVALFTRQTAQNLRDSVTHCYSHAVACVVPVMSTCVKDVDGRLHFISVDKGMNDTVVILHLGREHLLKLLSTNSICIYYINVFVKKCDEILLCICLFIVLMMKPFKYANSCKIDISHPFLV